MDFSLILLSLFSCIKVKYYYSVIFTVFMIFLYVIPVSSVFHQTETLAIMKKKTSRIFSVFFFQVIYLTWWSRLCSSIRSLGNLDTNTFLSREMIIYSYTLLPVIKPFPYLRQNIFHNNKETIFLNYLTTYRMQHF